MLRFACFSGIGLPAPSGAVSVAKQKGNAPKGTDADQRIYDTAQNGILTAGEITDYWDTYEGFMGIIGIGFGNVAYDAIEALVNGSYPGGEHSIYGLAEGGYYMDWESYERFAEANPDFAEIIEAGKAVEEKINSGEITVDYNTDEPNWSTIAG